MSLTLLLDLDDTLLSNDVDTFLPGYLKALARHIAHLVPLDRVARQILASTEKMVANTNPIRTLEEAFDSDFYPALATTKEKLFPALTDFYDHVFPSLSYLTSPRPEAVRLVEYAFQKGWQVVVATNPLFPMSAIQHRLAWANLPVAQYPFNLITSYEAFHFAKPTAAYYAEILAKLGWPNQPVVMVGNSLSDDLLPAGTLGIPGFWLTNTSTPLPVEMPPLSQKGSLDEVIPWLDKIEAANQNIETATIQGYQAILASTPAVLDTLGRNTTSDLWGLTPRPDEWCFTGIICHLRDADREVNLPRLDKIIGEENTFIEGINADAWLEERDYCSEDGYLALQSFAQSRVILLDRLKALSKVDLERQARHAIFGPTSLKELVSFIATHDRTHIQQALQTLRSVI
jgi:FMN phosphatase YigB (HAD superfamily)